MLLQIIHGAKKYQVEVGSEDEDVWTLSKLKEEIARLTTIPPESQRLIAKGRTIFGDDTTPLTGLGLKSNDKIMVLANSKPQKPQEVDVNLNNLARIESTIIQGMDEKLRELDSTLEGIEKGYLNDELVKEAVAKMDKQLKHFGEDCMRTLELMDAMQLSETGSDKARVKRKSLCNTVQDLLRRHDTLLERLVAVMTSSDATAPAS